MRLWKIWRLTNKTRLQYRKRTIFWIFGYCWLLSDVFNMTKIFGTDFGCAVDLCNRDRAMMSNTFMIKLIPHQTPMICFHRSFGQDGHGKTKQCFRKFGHLIALRNGHKRCDGVQFDVVAPMRVQKAFKKSFRRMERCISIDLCSIEVQTVFEDGARLRTRKKCGGRQFQF